MNNEGCPTQKVPPHPLLRPSFYLQNKHVSCRQKFYLPCRQSALLFFSGSNQNHWLTHSLLVAPGFIFWWTDSDDRLMNLWHISKTHSKNTPTGLFYAQSCNSWNRFLHWWRSLLLEQNLLWMSIFRLPAISLLFIIWSFFCWACWFAESQKHDWKLWPLWKRSDLESHSDDL